MFTVWSGPMFALVPNAMDRTMVSASVPPSTSQVAGNDQSLDASARTASVNAVAGVRKSVVVVMRLSG